jgi:hypothetical protein
MARGVAVWFCIILVEVLHGIARACFSRLSWATWRGSSLFYGVTRSAFAAGPSADSPARDAVYVGIAGWC